MDGAALVGEHWAVQAPASEGRPAGAALSMTVVVEPLVSTRSELTTPSDRLCDALIGGRSAVADPMICGAATDGREAN